MSCLLQGRRQLLRVRCENGEGAGSEGENAGGAAGALEGTVRSAEEEERTVRNRGQPNTKKRDNSCRRVFFFLFFITVSACSKRKNIFSSLSADSQTWMPSLLTSLKTSNHLNALFCVYMIFSDMRWPISVIWVEMGDSGCDQNRKPLPTYQQKWWALRNRSNILVQRRVKKIGFLWTGSHVSDC